MCLLIFGSFLILARWTFAYIFSKHVIALCYVHIYPSAGIVHSLMMEIFQILNSSYPTTDAMMDP